MNKSENSFWDYDVCLCKCMKLCVFLLILSQLFLCCDQLRSYMSQVDRIEGDRVFTHTPRGAEHTAVAISVASQDNE